MKKENIIKWLNTPVDPRCLGEEPPTLVDSDMSDNDIKKAVIILFDKGYTSDLQDTDSFYDAPQEILDKAYRYIDEIRAHGMTAFEKTLD